MFDAGADYNRPLRETTLWKAAFQLKVFDNWFMRFGVFDDQGKFERGSGAGIGWVQPRLVIDLSLKNTKISENELLVQEAEDIKESSFSISYRF